jgi:hypothetical protein
MNAQSLSPSHQSMLVEAGYSHEEVAKMVYCQIQGCRMAPQSDGAIGHYSMDGAPCCGDCWEDMPVMLVDDLDYMVCVFCDAATDFSYCRGCQEYKGLMTISDWESYTGEVWED